VLRIQVSSNLYGAVALLRLDLGDRLWRKEAAPHEIIPDLPSRQKRALLGAEPAIVSGALGYGLGQHYL
jgi:hypothetical protein